MTKYGFRSEREKLFPSMLVLDVSKVCNSRCIHCAYHIVKDDPRFRRSPNFMEWEIYKKIADECASYHPLNFRFTCHGEPLLNPKILDMIGYAKSKGIAPVSINTNGSLLNMDKIQRLIDCQIDIIEISLDALSREKYNLIRRTLDYDSVIDNIERLIEYRNMSKAKTSIFVSIIDQPEVKDEIEDFIKYWGKRVDNVIKRVYFTHDGLTDPKKVTYRIPRERHPCPFLWRRMVVTSDGIPKFCLEDWFDEKITPFTLNESIHKIWTSDWYRNIREIHLKGEFCELKFCSHCPDWWAHSWEKNYLTALGI